MCGTEDIERQSFLLECKDDTNNDIKSNTNIDALLNVNTEITICIDENKIGFYGC